MNAETTNDTTNLVYIGGRIEPALKKELEQIAAERKRSLNYVLEIFLRRGVAHHKTSQTTPPDPLEL